VSPSLVRFDRDPVGGTAVKTMPETLRFTVRFVGLALLITVRILNATLSHRSDGPCEADERRRRGLLGRRGSERHRRQLLMIATRDE